jgi:hyperosmotically inducible protein
MLKTFEKAMWKKLITATAAVLVFSTAPALAQVDRSNGQIFRDVSDTVLRYTSYTIFDDVRASVVDGAVMLEGKVTMPFKKKDIEKRISRIEGVQSVTNRIEVLPVSTYDDELRYRVARAIYGNPSFWNYASMVNPPIHIVVEGGRVRLTGVVHSEVDRMLARSLATTFGALSVSNELRTDAEARAELETLN